MATCVSLRFYITIFIFVRESWQSLCCFFFIASVAFFTQTPNKQLRAKTEGADHFQYLFSKG